MDKPSFKITPLGAAIVEAMPGRKLIAKIKRDFKRNGKCPVSDIFPTDKDIKNFYKETK